MQPVPGLLLAVALSWYIIKLLLWGWTGAGENARDILELLYLCARLVQGIEEASCRGNFRFRFLTNWFVWFLGCVVCGCVFCRLDSRFHRFDWLIVRYTFVFNWLG